MIRPEFKLDWVHGTTVQVLAPHPDDPMGFMWVHNILEQEPSNLAQFDHKPKPPGWGNGGGGLEKDDLETLAKFVPNHRIFTDNSLSDDERLAVAGGIREFICESGYRDIDIRTDYTDIFLYNYRYRDWVDKRGRVHLGGHRKITLWGQLNSLKTHKIIEDHEIDRTAWFDLSESLFGQFFNRLERPDRPYWSHVRAVLYGMLSIYRYTRDNTDGYVLNVPRRIHSSWRSVSQIGKGDDRFPDEGYRLSPEQWYHLFNTAVEKKMEAVSNDFLWELFGEEIGRERSPVDENTKEAKQPTSEVEGSEDSDGVPTVEEMRKQEDEEYARWFEADIPEYQRAL